MRTSVTLFDTAVASDPSRRYRTLLIVVMGKLTKGATMFVLLLSAIAVVMPLFVVQLDPSADTCQVNVAKFVAPASPATNGKMATP